MGKCTILKPGANPFVLFYILGTSLLRNVLKQTSGSQSDLKEKNNPVMFLWFFPGYFHNWSILSCSMTICKVALKYPDLNRISPWEYSTAYHSTYIDTMHNKNKHCEASLGIFCNCVILFKTDHCAPLFINHKCKSLELDVHTKTT